MKFNCPKHGCVEYVLLNGYAFGDRLLEDVMFQVRVDDKKQYMVCIDPDSANYFAQFNEKSWLMKAHEYMKGADLLECPTRGCKNDIAVDPWNEEWRDKKLFYDNDEV